MKKSILRQLIVTLAILMGVGIGIGVIAQNQKQSDRIFQDVPSSSFAYFALTALQQDGVLLGYPDHYFDGRRILTRYEFAVAIKRVLDILPHDILPHADAPGYPEGVPEDVQAKISSEDLTYCNRLFAEFTEELKALGVDTKRVKTRLDALQAAPPVNPRLIGADNAFGFRLFQELQKKDADANILFSPVGIALALDMTYNGANGSTKAAMEKALQLEGMSPETLNRANAALLANLKTPDPAVQLDIANGLWIAKEGQGVPVKPDFAQRNHDFYGAEIGDLAGAPDNVNAWVSKQTQGKIPTILNKGDMNNAVAVLVNAVYFKAPWSVKFDPAKTLYRTFTDGKGRKNPTKLMSQSGEYDYYQGDGFQMVSLLYASGRLSMELLLPNAGTPLSLLEGALTPDNWHRWTAALQKRHGDIQIPRMDLRYEADLKAPLTALGMGEAFTEQANFSGIASDTWIGKVRHKTFLSMNEEGTEAAAATGVVARTKGVMVGFRFLADHPFLCVLRDRTTGVILFLGAWVAAAFGAVINQVQRTRWGNLFNISHLIGVVWVQLFEGAKKTTNGALFFRVVAGEELPLWTCWMSLGILCLICLYMLARKIRGAEVVR